MSNPSRTARVTPHPSLRPETDRDVVPQAAAAARDAIDGMRLDNAISVRAGKARLVRAIAAVSAALAGGLPVVGYAQTGAIEEIVVSVQRRSETLSDVPISVTAVTGEFVRDVNLDDVKDLVAFTPGLTGNSKDSFIDALNIRGIVTNDFGVGGDPSIGIFKNNLYQGRNGAVVTSLYDIDRAEVLRGPQSFLFGRNTIAGAISVHTRRPELDVVNGYLDLDVAERGHRVAEGAINVPVSARVAVRLAGYKSDEDGYVGNAFDPAQDDLIGHHKSGARASLLWSGDRTEVNLLAEYETRRQSGSIYRATERGAAWENLQALFPDELGAGLAGGDLDSDSDMGLGEADDADIMSFGLEIEHDLGWATFNSNTGFKDHEYDYAEDFDGTPLHINDYAQVQEGDYLEQEFRLVSQSDSPLSWYGGVSFYRETLDATFTQAADEDVMCVFYYGVGCADEFPGFTYTPDGTLVESNRVRGRFEGWAAYVDLTYQVTPSVDASLGLRYTHDEKDFRLQAFDVASELGPFWAMGFTSDGFLQDNKEWNDLSPRLLVRWQPDDVSMVYGSVTRGYKSGGYGSFAIFPDLGFGITGVTRADARPDDFDPEEVLSWEVGHKGRFLDGRAQTEVSAYFYNYKDLQTVVQGNGGGILVDNIGDVDGFGIEGSVNLILNDYLDLYLAGAWAGTEANDVQAACNAEDVNSCEGNALPELPELSWSAVVQGHYPVAGGEWIARYELFGQSETGGGLEQDPAGELDGWTESALRAGFRASSGWEVLAYIENLTDEEYWDAAVPLGEILPAHYFGPSRPRTVGVSINWTFE
ncbi:MAG: TonB-dependent receptor [Gammaproteobacteria bacterium]